MKSIEWIDQLIKKEKIPSDRQAALRIGMTPQLISKHRNGKLVTLDDENAWKLEELLELPHGRIVADQHAERTTDPKKKAMWKQLAASAAALIIATAIGMQPNPAQAFESTNSKQILLIIGSLVRAQQAEPYKSRGCRDAAPFYSH